MNTIASFRPGAGRRALAAALLGLSLIQPAFALTCIWTGNGHDGLWDNRTNWSTMTVPVAGDKTYITNNATVAVTIDGDATFANLTVGGASGTVTLTWSEGWLTGTLVLESHAVLNLVNRSGDHILSGVITNYGTIAWQAGGWTFDNASRLENKPGGLVLFQCDQTVDCTGAQNSVINNAGTVRKLSGGETDISPTPAVALNNTGLIDVQGGALVLYGNGTNSGTINIAAGAVYGLANGQYWFATNNSFTGAGVCQMGNCSVFGRLQGPVTYSVVYDVTFNTELVSGTLVWNYTDGNQSGPLTIDSNAVYNIGSSCTVSGAVTNYGRIVYPAGSPWNTWSWNSPARLENRPGGVVDLQADLRFYDGTGVTFRNAGTLLKSGGTAESIIDPGFNFINTGTINVRSGRLTLNGLAASNLVSVAAGAVLDLATGKFKLGPTNTFAGPGTVALNLDASPGGPAIIGPLTGSADFEMDSDAAFTNCVLGGTLKWNSGAADGAIMVGTNGALVMVGSGSLSGSLTNLGLITFNPGGTNPGVMGTFGSLSVGGTYTQSNGAALCLGIGGRDTDQFDQLAVTGAAKLAGSLLVHLFNGFPPATSDTFTVLSYASRSGSFSPATLPGDTSLAYGSTGAKLSVSGLLPVQPMCLSPRLAAGKASFDVWTANHTNYTVYRSDTLAPANWVACSNFTGDGTCRTLSLPANVPTRFYRVGQ